MDMDTQLKIKKKEKKMFMDDRGIAQRFCDQNGWVYFSPFYDAIRINTLIFLFEKKKKLLLSAEQITEKNKRRYANVYVSITHAESENASEKN